MPLKGTKESQAKTGLENEQWSTNPFSIKTRWAKLMRQTHCATAYGRVLLRKERQRAIPSTLLMCRFEGPAENSPNAEILKRQL